MNHPNASAGGAGFVGGQEKQANVQAEPAPRRYVQQRLPDASVVVDGRVYEPEATLRCGDDVSHVVFMNGTYALVSGGYGIGFFFTPFWHIDAVAALVNLTCAVRLEVRV